MPYMLPEVHYYNTLTFYNIYRHNRKGEKGGVVQGTRLGLQQEEVTFLTF
jgi:hypothetical protein